MQQFSQATLRIFRGFLRGIWLLQPSIPWTSLIYLSWGVWFFSIRFLAPFVSRFQFPWPFVRLSLSNLFLDSHRTFPFSEQTKHRLSLGSKIAWVNLHLSPFLHPSSLNQNLQGVFEVTFAAFPGWRPFPSFPKSRKPSLGAELSTPTAFTAGFETPWLLVGLQFVPLTTNSSVSAKMYSANNFTSGIEGRVSNCSCCLAEANLKPTCAPAFVTTSLALLITPDRIIRSGKTIPNSSPLSNNLIHCLIAPACSCPWPPSLNSVSDCNKTALSFCPPGSDQEEIVRALSLPFFRFWAKPGHFWGFQQFVAIFPNDPPLAISHMILEPFAWSNSTSYCCYSLPISAIRGSTTANQSPNVSAGAFSVNFGNSKLLRLSETISPMRSLEDLTPSFPCFPPFPFKPRGGPPRFFFGFQS